MIDPYESLAALSRRLHAHEVTPTEVVEASLTRIVSHDPVVNAFITVMADRAIADARAADARFAAGESRGPLEGVPVALKDLIQTAGVRTTAASAILEGWVPDEDATVVRKLRDTGAVIIGKTNLHEFAFGTTTTASHFGPTHNPLDLDRHAGGSSGGSAAAVAAGFCYAAIGTDTGGSIRIPAAMCGIVGLMPTYGLVSRAGVIPLSWSLDHVGPLARTVEDTALVFDAIRGYDPADRTSMASSPGEASEGIGGSLEGLRLGVVRSAAERCEPGVAAAFEAALDLVRSLGLQFDDVHVPILDDGVTFGAVIAAEAAAYHLEYLRTVPEKYTPEVRTRLMAGLTIPAYDYINELRLRREFTDGVRALMGPYDVLIAPTCPRVAGPIDGAGSTGPFYSSLTAPWNHTGQPVIAVPCGPAEDGLPASISFIGRPFEEAPLLALAHAFEQASGTGPRPSLD